MALHEIRRPADLRGLTYEELDDLCGEIRDFVVQAVSVTGSILARTAMFAGHAHVTARLCSDVELLCGSESGVLLLGTGGAEERFLDHVLRLVLIADDLQRHRLLRGAVP